MPEPGYHPEGYGVQFKDDIAQEAREVLEGYEMGPDVTNPDAIIVRSSKLHDMEVGSRLSMVARAGSGTDNIPIERLAELGILVVNTPGANANAVAELTFALMGGEIRNTQAALEFVQSLKDIESQDELDRIVERHKKQFKGTELARKTMCVIGLGQVGGRVAEGGIDRIMHVYGYDPLYRGYVASRVKRVYQLREGLDHAHFVTLHAPLTDRTRHMIDEDALRQMQDGVVVLNLARRELVDPVAMRAALDSGKVSRYIEDNPTLELLGHPRVVSTPHLGASTSEAGVEAGVQAALGVDDWIKDGTVRNSPGMQDIIEPRREQYPWRIVIIHHDRDGADGRISTLLGQEGYGIAGSALGNNGRIGAKVVDLKKRPQPDLFKRLEKHDDVVRLYYRPDQSLRDAA